MTLPIFIAVVKIHIRPGSQSGLPWYSDLCSLSNGLRPDSE